jgi:hypothetical protein
MAHDKPAIVVVAYKRTNSLKRLLKTLNDAEYKEDVTLVVSIDKSDNPGVVAAAEAFEWKGGGKRIITTEVNLGLRNHVIQCGDLTAEYGSIIILEDDLAVSPHFYEFAANALKFYGDDEEIAGISLYNNVYNGTSTLPIETIRDASDVYFMQIASSWGQAWNARMWNGFRKWSKGKRHIDKIRGIPDNVSAWPESSWKKYYNAYLVDKKKYFVHPKTSLTTNYCSPGGTHITNKTTIYQTPFWIQRREMQFVKKKDSLAVYDIFGNILEDILKKMNPELEKYDFDVDLLGNKKLLDISRPYILTLRKCRKYVKSYGLDLKPIELNVIMKNPGHDIGLAKREDVINSRIDDIIRYEKYINFFFDMPSSKRLLSFIVLKIIRKMNFGRKVQ